MAEWFSVRLLPVNMSYHVLCVQCVLCVQLSGMPENQLAQSLMCDCLYVYIYLYKVV